MSEERPVDPADDDAYRRLFRPDDAPETSPAPTPEAAPAPVPAAVPPAREPGVDTGRLFRSARVPADTAALPAVIGDQASRLRTLVPGDSASPAPIRVNSAEPRPAAALLGATQTPAAAAEPTEREEAHAMPRESRQSGVTPMGVYAVTIGATVVAGLLDILIGGPGLGATSGVVLLIASIFCALRVRVSDAAVAVIAPPIAFLVATITVGQIGMSATGGFLGRVVGTFFMLADNWVWIIGSTIVALAIVLVRGRGRGR